MSNPYMSQAKSAPLGEPPNYFGANERAAWLEISNMDAGNSLTVQDRLLVELASALLVHARDKGMANLPSMQTLALHRTLNRLRQRMMTDDCGWNGCAGYTGSHPGK